MPCGCNCFHTAVLKMASVYNACVICTFLWICVVFTNSQNTTEAPGGSTTSSINGTDKSCSLVPADDDTVARLNEILASNPKLVRYDIKFDSYSNDILIDSSERIYRPSKWFRVSDRAGESLLQLDENFEILSLTLLRIGVARFQANVTDRPTGCFGELSPDARVKKLRILLLNDFKRTDAGKEGARICNMKVKPVRTNAEFVHTCCSTDSMGNHVCTEVMSDLWLSILLVMILVIKVLFVLYSPYFVPELFYRQKYVEAQYYCSKPLSKPVNIVKTSGRENYSGCLTIPLKKLEGFKNLKMFLSKIECDKVSKVKVQKIKFIVKARRLLPGDFVPVSIMNMAFDKLFRCTLRRNQGFQNCCDARLCICKRCPEMTWYRCFRLFTKIVLLGLLILPWIVRVVFFYRYENEIVTQRWTAAERYGLAPSFLGSLVRYLTPIHGLFIFIYIIVIVDLLTYGLLFASIKRLCNVLITESLENVHEGSHSEVIEWGLRVVLRPCEKYGILGVLLAPLYLVFVLPCALIAVAFNIFPALNFTINLILRVFVLYSPVGAFRSCIKKEEEEEYRNVWSSAATVAYRLMIVIMSLISFWSLTLLFMECIALAVEIGIYTLMGIIINAGTTMQFVSIVFILFLYAKDSFGSVQITFLDFHKVTRDLLIARKFEDIQTTARQDEGVQENTAFQVLSSDFPAEDNNCEVFEFTNSFLVLRLKGILLFLDSVDKTFTTEKFFYSSTEMNYCNAPGTVWTQTVRASYSFLKIVIFLCFVLLVVLAFGNVYTISTTNQLLATVAGAFVPFLFRYVFKRGGPGSLGVDSESVQFKNEFERIIANYNQKWPLMDMELEEITDTTDTSASNNKDEETATVSPDGVVIDSAEKETSDKTTCAVSIEASRNDDRGDSKDGVPDLVFVVGSETTEIVDDNAMRLVPLQGSKVSV